MIWAGISSPRGRTRRGAGKHASDERYTLAAISVVYDPTGERDFAPVTDVLGHRGSRTSARRIGPYWVGVNERDKDGHYGVRSSTAGEITVFVEGWLTAPGHLDQVAEAVAESGGEVLSRLEGSFFAVAIDRRSARAFAYRDGSGLRPVVYASGVGHLVLTAERKAVLTATREPAELDRESLAHVLLTGLEQPAHTLLKDVMKLRRDHLLSFDPASGVRVWRLARRSSGRPRYFCTDADVRELIGDSLEKGLDARLAGWGDVGLLLSGGIDSYLIGEALSGGQVGSITAYTAGIRGFERDEVDYAKRFAHRLGVNHRVRRYDSREGPPLRDLLVRAVRIMQQPSRFANSLLLIHLLDAWREHPGVVLSGDGADGMFGERNYKEFTLWRIARRLGLSSEGTDLRRYGIEAASRDQFERLMGRDAYSAVAAEYARLRDEVASAGPSRQYCHVHMATEGQGFVDKLERITAVFGMDVICPFLLPAMREIAWSLPLWMKWRPRTSKPILRQLAARTLPKQDVDRRKIGFDVPIRDWLRNDESLREAVFSLEDPNARIRGFVDGKALSRIVRQAISERSRMDETLLWRLLATELWCREFGV